MRPRRAPAAATRRSTAPRSGPTTSSRPSRIAGSARSPPSPTGPVASATAWSSPRSSSTSRCSSGSGASTDVVRKEMYEFEDKGGRRLALRPEGTAPVVRAFVQHRPPVPWKVWYLAPHFRYERPQKGRYRQHWQLGAEVIGVDDPEVDVEVDRAGPRVLPGSGSAAGPPARSTRWATPSPGPPTSPRCATTCSRTAPASATSSGPGSSRTRCGCSTRSTRSGRTSSSGRRSSPST